MRRVGLFALIGLVGFIGLVGLVRLLGPGGQAAPTDLLRVGNGPEPQALDPHLTTGTAALNIQRALFEGLVGPHPETLDPQPAVAERWERDVAGRHYTFYLREDARWSDGEPVTAGDFVAAWQRALLPEQAAPYAEMLYVLKGARAFNQGNGLPGDLGVRAAGPKRLEVELAEPVPYFLQLLMHPVWFPVPEHYLPEENGREGSWCRPATFCGNGPFVLEEWHPNEFVEVAANPLYWDSATVTLSGIRFFAIDEPAAEERAFLAGQLDVTDALPPSRVPAYRERRPEVLRIEPYLGTYYLLANVREGVLADPRVRRALSLAIDRRAITEHLLGAGQTPAGGFVPPAMPGYDPSFAVEHDPAAARRLLAEAGYPEGEGFPGIEYLFNTSESHKRIAEALQEMWRSELGIHLQLVNLEWRTYLQRRAESDFQLARAVWIGDYPEPSTFLHLWRVDSANNWAGWSHPEYDRLLATARTEPDPQRRGDLYAEAEALLLREQAILPLYHYVTVFLQDPAVRNWAGNLLDWPVYQHVRLRRPTDPAE